MRRILLNILLSLIVLCHEGNTSCSYTEFPCNNGKCVICSFLCDKDNDCGDGSDEDVDICNSQSPDIVPWVSANHSCAITDFTCNNAKCIRCIYRCDGDDDCGDGSDEDPKMCTDPVCSDSQFKCGSRECIPALYLCDVGVDCSDGSDEDSTICASYACPVGKYKCTDGKCIASAFVCDDNNDCEDGSDEDREMCEKRN